MGSITIQCDDIKKHITEFNDEIRSIPTSFGEEELYDEVKEKLFDSIKKSVAGVKECGVLFSGGVDSVVIAQIARKFVGVRCYTAAMENSQDLDFAKRAAEEMGLEHKIKVIGYEEVPGYAEKVVNAIGETNIMKVGVGIPIYASCEIAEEKRLLGGFGAEELFVGYAKFKDFSDWDDLQNRLWEGLYEIGWKDKYRDCCIARKNNKEICAPMLNFDLIKTVMGVHPKYKINEKQDKLLLRKIAKEAGVPEFIYNRPKKATQYGSGIDKAIRKLAKSKGLSAEEYLTTFLS